MKCMVCGTESINSWMIVIYDPKRPKGARKRDYILGHCCDNSKCESKINLDGVRDE